MSSGGEARALAQADAYNAIRCLAAAERAVEEGRMNLAKVLRAMALASRTRALALERAASAGAPATDTLRDVAAHISALGDPGGIRALAPAAGTQTALLDRALAALAETRDVPESVVAQLIWGCAECGALFESQRPEVCAACGSIAGDFELFAPFYSGTAERLSRRQPDEIIAMLRGDSAELRSALAGVDDARLHRRPAEGEWCMAEIAGHMADIAELFNRRLTVALDPAAEVAAERSPLPWRLLEGQGYETMPREELQSRFDAAITQALALIERLGEQDWRRGADMIGGAVRIIDMASWLANHNVSHRQQIIALREA